MLLILVLVIIGVLLYLVNNFVPMSVKIRKIINVVIVVIVVLWMLGIFLGNWGELNNIKISR